MHVIGAHGDPVTLQGAGGKRVVLEGDFAMQVSGHRICIGAYDEGQHVPCPTQEIVTQDIVCRGCSGLENPECVFEPKCQNDPSQCACLQSFAGVEHVVYMAFHGLLPKIGLTQAWRTSRRLTEQGADLYFVIQGGLDRPGARSLERSLSMQLGIPEFRTHRDLFAQYLRPLPWDAMRRRAEDWHARLTTTHQPGPVREIRDYSVALPLPAPPNLRQAHGPHQGRWLGAKGNHVFFVDTDTPLATQTVKVSALRRMDLVGRLIRFEPDASLPAAAHGG